MAVTRPTVGVVVLKADVDAGFDTICGYIDTNAASIAAAAAQGSAVGATVANNMATITGARLALHAWVDAVNQVLNSLVNAPGGDSKFQVNSAILDSAFSTGASLVAATTT